jgi:hypothetical protein
VHFTGGICCEDFTRGSTLVVGKDVDAPTTVGGRVSRSTSLGADDGAFARKSRLVRGDKKFMCQRTNISSLQMVLEKDAPLEIQVLF